MREKALWIQKAAVPGDIVALAEQSLAFTLILNPMDPLDWPIRALIRTLKTAPAEAYLTEFHENVKRAYQTLGSDFRGLVLISRHIGRNLLVLISDSAIKHSLRTRMALQYPRAI